MGCVVVDAGGHAKLGESDHAFQEGTAMVVACFCGELFTTIGLTEKVFCPACERRAHPPEIIIHGRLRHDLAEILARMPWDDDCEREDGEER